MLDKDEREKKKDTAEAGGGGGEKGGGGRGGGKGGEVVQTSRILKQNHLLSPVTATEEEIATNIGGQGWEVASKACKLRMEMMEMMVMMMTMRRRRITS